MSNIIQGDFGINRCRNSEAEKRYNAPIMDLTETQEDAESIALHDRVLDLMEDPNALDTNFFYNFWESNSDAWLEMISINHKSDLNTLDANQLRYRVSVLFNFLDRLQLAAESQALEEKAENE